MILPMEFDPFLGEEVYPKDQLGPSCGFDSFFFRRILGSPNHQLRDPMILRAQNVWHVAVFRWPSTFIQKLQQRNQEWFNKQLASRRISCRACCVSRTSYIIPDIQYMDVSENSGTRKSSSLIGFSNINHPFWDTLIFGNTHMVYSTRFG